METIVEHYSKKKPFGCNVYQGYEQNMLVSSANIYNALGTVAFSTADVDFYNAIVYIAQQGNNDSRLLMNTASIVSVVNNENLDLISNLKHNGTKTIILAKDTSTVATMRFDTDGQDIIQYTDTIICTYTDTNNNVCVPYNYQSTDIGNARISNGIVVLINNFKLKVTILATGTTYQYDFIGNTPIKLGLVHLSDTTFWVVNQSGKLLYAAFDTTAMPPNDSLLPWVTVYNDLTDDIQCDSRGIFYTKNLIAGLFYYDIGGSTIELVEPGINMTKFFTAIDRVYFSDGFNTLYEVLFSDPTVAIVLDTYNTGDNIIGFYGANENFMVHTDAGNSYYYVNNIRKISLNIPEVGLTNIDGQDTFVYTETTGVSNQYQLVLDTVSLKIPLTQPLVGQNNFYFFNDGSTTITPGDGSLPTGTIPDPKNSVLVVTNQNTNQVWVSPNGMYLLSRVGKDWEIRYLVMYSQIALIWLQSSQAIRINSSILSLRATCSFTKENSSNGVNYPWPECLCLFNEEILDEIFGENRSPSLDSFSSIASCMLDTCADLRLGGDPTTIPEQIVQSTTCPVDITLCQTDINTADSNIDANIVQNCSSTAVVCNGIQCQPGETCSSDGICMSANDNGLAPGAIAGIVVAIIVAILIIVLGTYYGLKAKKK